MIFKNRADAGKRLTEVLQKYRGQNTIIYALPRGGVVVGAEIAGQLDAPLDLLIVRKIGHPQNPEFAIGAVSESGETIFNQTESANVNPDYLKQEKISQQAEARRRRLIYLQNKPSISAKGKTTILVDDGVATGLTMKAAILEIQKQQPKKIVVAIPVAPLETVKELATMVDEVVVLDSPENFTGAVGAYYEDFPQVMDKEVVKLLK